MDNNKIKTVLVTGAAGGIGWVVTKMLLERGCKVIAADAYVTGLKREEKDGVTWLDLDVADPSLAEKLNAYPIDAVIHCAARLADRSMQEPSADVRTNAFGSMQVFEWAARKGVERVVYLSSSAVYGSPASADPIKETAAYSPDTMYAVCKMACENFLRILQKGYGLKWTVVRLFPTYGPTHKLSKTQGILNVMMTQLLEGNEVIVKGSLDRVRDLVYVDDTAAAVVGVLFSENTVGKTFNVGKGWGTTVREMIYAIAKALGKKPEDLVIKELPGTPGDPMYNVADVSALNKATGFKAKVDLPEGIARMVEMRRKAQAEEMARK